MVRASNPRTDQDGTGHWLKGRREGKVVQVYGLCVEGCQKIVCVCAHARVWRVRVTRAARGRFRKTTSLCLADLTPAARCCARPLRWLAPPAPACAAFAPPRQAASETRKHGSSRQHAADGGPGDAAGHARGRHLGADLHFELGAAQDAEARACGRADGGYGAHAGGLCRRLHRARRRRVCHAAERDGGECGGGRPRLSDQDA